MTEMASGTWSHNELELKLCPFCGGKAELYSNEEGDCHPSWVSDVECVDCWARVDGEDRDREKSRQEAIEKWNRRV